MLLDENKVFVALHDKDKSSNAKTYYGSLDKLQDTLSTLNSGGYGIFAAVNEFAGKTRTKDACLGVNSLFIDIDTVDPDRVFDYALEPSCIIESSPGKHHVYWYTDGSFPLEEFTTYQLALANRFGSDPVVTDLPRILRVPGFNHCKGEPFAVHVIGGNSRRYSLSELRDFVKPDEDTDAIAVLNSCCEAIRTAPEGQRNNTLNTQAYIALGLVKAERLARDYVRDRLVSVALATGLEIAEIKATLNSAYRTATSQPASVQLLSAHVDADDPLSDGEELVVRSGDAIVPRAYQWVWEGWLARGVMHILAGAPGTGKTTAAIGLGAIITQGDYMPDGYETEAQNVVIWSGEDDIETTLAPRFLAAGADMSKVKFVCDIKKGDDTRLFNPAEDAKSLRAYLRNLGDVGLVIIDPIISAVAGDSHKSNDVRTALREYSDIAQECNAPLLGITHLTKGTQGREPLERVTGSIAFGAFARFVFLCAKSDDRHVFAKVKANVHLDRGGFEYAIRYKDGLPGYPSVSSTYAAFGVYLEDNARAILESAEEAESAKQERRTVVSFLNSSIGEGKSIKSVVAEAKLLGITPDLVRRVALSIGYEIIEDGRDIIYKKKAT